jgi:hypothetical protein
LSIEKRHQFPVVHSRPSSDLIPVPRKTIWGSANPSDCGGVCYYCQSQPSSVKKILQNAFPFRLSFLLILCQYCWLHVLANDVIRFEPQRTPVSSNTGRGYPPDLGIDRWFAYLWVRMRYASQAPSYPLPLGSGCHWDCDLISDPKGDICPYSRELSSKILMHEDRIFQVASVLPILCLHQNPVSKPHPY